MLYHMLIVDDESWGNSNTIFQVNAHLFIVFLTKKFRASLFLVY